VSKSEVFLFFQEIAIRELKLGVFEGWEMLQEADGFEVLKSGLYRARGEVGDLSDFTGTELEFACVVSELEEGFKKEFAMFDAVFAPAVGVGLSEEKGI
jgi:hypothetical protein